MSSSSKAKSAERISLPKLRRYPNAPMAVNGNVVLALVETVEAAQVVRDHDDNDPGPLRPTLEAMYAKLARFDFSEPDAP